MRQGNIPLKEMRVKLFLKEKCQVDETEVEIRCVKRDSEVDNIIKSIKDAGATLIGEKENGDILQISVKEVLYFEAVDRHVYAYLKNEVLRVRSTLYDIEQNYHELFFVRISKSLIVNIRGITGIRPEDGRRVRLLLSNNEWIVVSKNYVSSLKKAIGMKGVKNE